MQLHRFDVSPSRLTGRTTAQYLLVCSFETRYCVLLSMLGVLQLLRLSVHKYGFVYGVPYRYISRIAIIIQIWPLLSFCNYSSSSIDNKHSYLQIYIWFSTPNCNELTPLAVSQNLKCHSIGTPWETETIQVDKLKGLADYYQSQYSSNASKQNQCANKADLSKPVATRVLGLAARHTPTSQPAIIPEFSHLS